MIQIVKMDTSHVMQVAELEALCFTAPWSANSLRGELDNSLSCWLIALDGDRVAGYIGSQSVLGESDMMNVAVHPDYRRKGVAEALVGSLIDVLRSEDNYSLTLEVRASNAAAIALYQKLGFFQVGRRPNYYRTPREDALILRKEWTV